MSRRQFWVLAVVAVALFWSAVGYGIHAAFAEPPRPDPHPRMAHPKPDPPGHSCRYSGIKHHAHGATSSAVCVKVR